MPTMARILMALSITVVMTPAVPSAETDFADDARWSDRVDFGHPQGWNDWDDLWRLALGIEIISTQLGQGAALQFNPMLAISQGLVGGIAVLLQLLYSLD